MADRAKIIARVRTELGDFGSTFRDVFLGTAELDSYDLSVINVDSVTVTARPSGGSVTTLTTPQHYSLDQRAGRVLLNGIYAPLPDATTLVVAGTSFGMFSDDDLNMLMDEAVLMHASGRTVRHRYRDVHGFIRFDDEPITLETLPPVEELPLALLVTVNCLWVLATDASGTTDVDTADGTHVDRRGRYEQLINQIALVEERYSEICASLNVGLDRIEMFDLRRVSRTTGRLVPIFKAQEYDDYSLPTRKIPAVDSRNEDDSNIPSIAYFGWW